MQTGLCIDGHWQDGASRIENRTPSDVSDLIGLFALASADQLDMALDAARRVQTARKAAGIQKRSDMGINRAKMLAPIACVMKAGRYDKALSIASDSGFGLTAGIMTRSLSRAGHFRTNMLGGPVMVNFPTGGTDYHMPLGGRGASSFGPREHGTCAADVHTTVKTALVTAGAAA